MSSPTLSTLSLGESVVVRPMKSADIPQIAQLHRTSLTAPFIPTFYRQLLIHADRMCLVACMDSSPQNVVGFVSASISIVGSESDLSTTDSSQAPVPRVQILTLAVLPEYRRQGIASRLVHDIVRSLRATLKQSTFSSSDSQVSAHVGLSNEDGQKFYSAVGLKSEDQPVPNAYRHHSIPVHDRDALLVVGKLGGPEWI